MAEKTIYCARAFWVSGGSLTGGEVYQFSTEERALEGGRALFTGAHGVAVYSVSGYPDTDVWGDPVLLCELGQVPPLEGHQEHLAARA